LNSLSSAKEAQRFSCNALTPFARNLRELCLRGSLVHLRMALQSTRPFFFLHIFAGMLSLSSSSFVDFFNFGDDWFTS
jgi:hypothetical protein